MNKVYIASGIIVTALAIGLAYYELTNMFNPDNDDEPKRD